MSRSVSDRARRRTRRTRSNAAVVEQIHAPTPSAASAPASAVQTQPRRTIAETVDAALETLFERLRVVRRIAEGVGIAELLAMAFAVRALYVLTAGFPLNDGGLFYVFAEDIQAAGYALPSFSSYNDGTIPFAYPPLAFYLAAALDDLTPLSLLDVIWLLPMVESVASVGAFYLLARMLLKDRWTVVMATLAFALVPRSFIWLIMGGGLTRALALTFAILAIHQARQACQEDRWQPAVRASVLLALTVLTTLETASWLAFTLPLFTVIPFQWQRVVKLGAIGLGALALTAPWWALIIARHGLDPFLAAREYGGSAIGQGDVVSMWTNLLNPLHTGEPFFPLIAALGLLGAVYALIRGDWLLPVWWAVTVVMGTRAFPTLAAIPTAMLAAVAVRYVVGPALVRAGTEVRDGVARIPRVRQLAIGAVGVFVLLFLVGASLEDTRGDQVYLRSLTTADVEAMEWISEETPEDARFLVLSRNGWFADRDGEWFPALAERENVATVQGYEWVAGEFERRGTLQMMAQMCLPGEGNCLGQIALEEPFDYVYVPETCCGVLRELIEQEWRYAVIFDNGAAVLEVVTGPVRPEGPDAYSNAEIAP